MARRAHTQGIPGVIWRLDEPSGSLLKSVSPSWGTDFYPPYATSWHFQFNGNTDNSAPYEGGTISTFGAPTYVAGKVGSQAISLNGTTDYLETASSASTTVAPIPPNVHNHIIGHNGVALKAAAQRAGELGYHVESLGSGNEGVADDEGRGGTVAAAAGTFAGGDAAGTGGGGGRGDPEPM